MVRNYSVVQDAYAAKDRAPVDRYGRSSKTWQGYRCKGGGKEALRHLKFEHLHLILLKVGIF